MRATVWHGRRGVRVDTVPDPVIGEPCATSTPGPTTRGTTRFEDEGGREALFGRTRPYGAVRLERAPMAHETFRRTYEVSQREPDGATRLVVRP